MTVDLDIPSVLVHKRNSDSVAVRLFQHAVAWTDRNQPAWLAVISPSPEISRHAHAVCRGNGVYVLLKLRGNAVMVTLRTRRLTSRAARTVSFDVQPFRFANYDPRATLMIAIRPINLQLDAQKSSAGSS